MLFCKTSASLRAPQGVEVRRSDRFRSFARGTHAFAPIQLPLNTNLMVPLRPQLMGTSAASEGCRFPLFYGFSAHLSSCSRPKSSSMGWTNLLKCDSTCERYRESDPSSLHSSVNSATRIYRHPQHHIACLVDLDRLDAFLLDGRKRNSHVRHGGPSNMAWEAPRGGRLGLGLGEVLLRMRTGLDSGGLGANGRCTTGTGRRRRRRMRLDDSFVDGVCRRLRPCRPGRLGKAALSASKERHDLATDTRAVAVLASSIRSGLFVTSAADKAVGGLESLAGGEDQDEVGLRRSRIRSKAPRERAWI